MKTIGLQKRLEAYLRCPRVYHRTTGHGKERFQFRLTGHLYQLHLVAVQYYPLLSLFESVVCDQQHLSMPPYPGLRSGLSIVPYR